jgi:RHS repeat-associated protein
VREKWSSAGTLLGSQSTKYIRGVDGNTVASLTTGTDLTTLALNGAGAEYTYSALAGMMNTSSVTGIFSWAGYSAMAFLLMPGASRWIVIAVFAAALMLTLFADLRYIFGIRLRLLALALRTRSWRTLFERGVDDRMEHAYRRPLLAHLSVLFIVLLITTVGCGNEGSGPMLYFGNSSMQSYNGMPYGGGYSALLTGDTSMGLPVGTYFYINDHLGSSSVITDATGAEVTRITYLPYGEIDHVNSPGNDTVTQKFTGQEFDPESQLHNYRARYYNASLGIFTTPDTIVPNAGDTQASNRYMYTLGNPVRYTDPTGHSIGDPVDFSTLPVWQQVLAIVGLVLLAAATVALIIVSGGTLAPAAAAAWTYVGYGLAIVGSIATTAGLYGEFNVGVGINSNGQITNGNGEPYAPPPPNPGRDINLDEARPVDPSNIEDPLRRPTPTYSQVYNVNGMPLPVDPLFFLANTGKFGEFRGLRGATGLDLLLGLGIPIFHNGIDLPVPEGTPLPALGDGEIVGRTMDGYNDGNAGNAIWVRYGSGRNSITVSYMHMSDPSPYRIGDHVSYGQVLGNVGSSGHSTGPHLHMEIRDYNWRPIAPRWWTDLWNRVLQIH